MSDFKKIIKNKKTIVWLSSTVLLVGLIVTVNILANKFGSLVNGVLGGERAIIDPSTYHAIYKPDQGIKTKKDALENGNKVTQKICDEGMVLLKNEGNTLPLPKGSRVSVFGKNSVNLVYGGSGSAAPTQSVPLKTIYDALEGKGGAGFHCNPELKKFYKSSSRSGSGRSSNPDMEHGDSIPVLKTGETPMSKYDTKVKDSYSSDYKDAAIVVFSRIAGENWDLPRVAADNGPGENRHYLELDKNERDLLAHVCSPEAGFAHVIVLFNGSNNIDMAFLKMTNDPAYNSKIDAAILIGSPGATGIMSLGRILNGDVNPSGHLTDTIYTHYDQDPTWQNFGDNFSTYGDAYILDQGLGDKNPTKPYYSVAYEEGIYLGYRYYETRGHIEGEEWYNEHVLYPFGYGLSYTEFEQEIVNKSDLGTSFEADEDFTIDVKVKNIGTKAGKQVVQIYASAPYEAGVTKIQKSHKVLVGFAKTEILDPQEEETLSIDITPYDFASFDDESNGNGYNGYILESGDYTFYLGENAHQESDSIVLNLASEARIEEDPVTENTVEPVLYTTFSDEKTYLNKFLQQELNRDDFAGTMPVMPTREDRTVDAKFFERLDSKITDEDDDYTKRPTMGAPKTLDFFEDMKGLQYNDPKWNQFLDQMTFQEMLDLFNKGMYSTERIQRLGIPKTISVDGPTGLVAFMGTPEVYGTCYYCSECLVAQTFNLKLAEEQGNAVGNEALLGDQRLGGSSLPYTGWYSPGVNLHRSPFSGRNTEYYSEDPFISGKMAARVIEKSQEKGVYTTIKHFALNEQETHRSKNGQNYWVREQVVRELYLKPFEIAIKEGKSRGLMSSFTRVGRRWCGGSYPLLTTILRDEWGFRGTVICDFHTDDYMNNKIMAYAGGDLNLTGTKYWNASVNEDEDCFVLRRAAHNTLYALANSNAVNQKIIGYKLPLWRELVYIGEGVIGAGFLVWGFCVIFAALGLWPKQKRQAAAKAEQANAEPAEKQE
ncbi:MAG: glycoside hydrolase family 3 protein [Bacilli bacterium]|nr:glycoside hydrolase family 3 protein [Bacilli bacterium]